MTHHKPMTIAFPDSGLRARVDARITDHQQDGVKFVVYSAEEQSPGVSRDSIEGIILPYMKSDATIDLLADLPNLRYVQTQSTGYDNVVGRIDPARVTLATAAGVHAAATAELALGLTLASLRGIDTAARNMPAHRWAHSMRPSLVDRRVLIVGSGTIGNEIFDRFVPFGVELTRAASTGREDSRGLIHATTELPQLLPEADVVVLVTPLRESTRNLVDAEFLSKLPDGALVINVGRGGVVDTSALLAELQSERLFAALDVVEPEPLPAEHPLWEAPNLLLTPHVGGNTDAFPPRIEALLEEQVRRLQVGEELLNVVDLS